MGSVSDDPKAVLGRIDALVNHGRRRDYVNAAAATATAANMSDVWVDMAARGAAREFDDAREAGREPLSATLPPQEFQKTVDGRWRHPVFRAREQRVRAARDEGRITPAEVPRILAAMNVDEAAATALLDRLPPGRLPLQPCAIAPDPEAGPLAGVAPGGPLPDGVSLLSRTQRAEIAARREQ